VRAIGLALAVAGVGVIGAFCGVWPATRIGSDYAVNPGGGVLAAALGLFLLVVGLGIVFSGRGGPPRGP
jgi:hypothetical protein